MKYEGRSIAGAFRISAARPYRELETISAEQAAGLLTMFGDDNEMGVTQPSGQKNTGHKFKT